jgi:metallo-beta-lactamase family protein
VERTQELLLLLARTWHEGRLPRELPIILDSPLATAALTIYSDHRGLFDAATRDFLAQAGQNPKGLLPTLHITRDARESQALNDLTGPAIIIAGSGMANAGRILHHLKHNLWRPNCHVIFVGFQAQGTTGRRLIEGARAVKIFRESVRVEAQIHTIGGFSGHADQEELLAWLRRQAHPGLTVNLIHGEPASTRNFYELARRACPEVNFHIPTWLSYAALGEEPAAPESGVSLTSVAGERGLPALLRRLERLRDGAATATALPPDQLALLENCLAQAESLILTGAAGRARV